MKHLWRYVLVLGLLLTALPAIAGEEKEAEKEPVPELHIGDKAPALDGITKWVKGKEVDLAKTNKVTVVEFWATWCGPCIASIPHLTELQHKHKDKVTIIGLSSEDPNNSQEAVEKFVKEQGKKMDYTVAFIKSDKLDRAYMEATDQHGIPTAYVIDQKGRVAWYGHPMGELGDVIEEVLAGTYDLASAKLAIPAREAAQEAMWSGEFDDAIARLDAWAAAAPQDPKVYAWQTRVYLAQEKPEKAKAAAKKAIPLAKTGDELASIANELVQTEGDEHGLNKMALKAAEQARVMDPNSTEAAVAHFRVLSALGKNDEALASAESSVSHLKGDAAAMGTFARVLSSPSRDDKRCDDLAIKAIDLAIKADPDNAAYLMDKFDIQVRCKKDYKAAEETGRYLIEKASEDASLLNNFTWNLLTEEELEGNFNPLALAAAERLEKLIEKDNWMTLDTIALVKFKNGKVDEAIDIQEQVVKHCENDALRKDFQSRLDEYRAGKKH